MVALMPTLNIFLSIAIILKATMQNNVSDFGDYPGKYLSWNSVIRDSNFTHGSETYDIGKPYLCLDSSFFSV